MLVVLALVGGGLCAGWWLASDRDLVEAEAAADVDSGPAERGPDEAEVLMPDLRGLSEASARQILADIGVPAELVSRVDRPAAGEPGVVNGQQPAYGYAVEGEVVLAVATPANVPEVDGRSAADVLDELHELGAEVTTETRYVAGTPIGDVAEVSPAPGTLLPVAVTMVIAGEPYEVPVSLLDAEDYGCSSDSGAIGTTTYDDLLECEVSYGWSDEPTEQSWLLNGAAERLTGVVGVANAAEPGTRARVVVRGDGEALATYDVTIGAGTPVDLDVRGVLRLSVAVSPLGEDEEGAAALADLTLLGDEAALTALVGEDG